MVAPQIKRKSPRRAQSPLALAERLRVTTCEKLSNRSSLGQFLTPPTVAKLLSAMFGPMPLQVRLLDPGSGIGALTAAFVEEICSRDQKPETLHLTAVEMEPKFLPHLECVLESCVNFGGTAGVKVSIEIRNADFLELGRNQLSAAPLLFEELVEFSTVTHVITNPPYAKINAGSAARRLIRECGLETSNLYTGFLWLAAKLLEPGGELVGITPRSFCNGPYFLPFREQFLGAMALDRLHTFERRDVLFGGDEVLQENLIFRAQKGGHASEVLLTSTNEKGKPGPTRTVPYAEIVHPKDPQKFIHLVLDANGHKVKDLAQTGGVSLKTLDIQVSTGRVVDFRATPWLRKDPEPGTVPLIYPKHLSEGWPIPGFKKHNAFAVLPENEDQLVPNGVYVLVKRFTSKEEKRRVVAFLYEPIAAYAQVGFENHLNYFHTNGQPLEKNLAKGLAAFLNSGFVDTYFRQFSGHTQVNATDLRSLRYPTLDQLRELGWSKDVERDIERHLGSATAETSAELQPSPL